MAFSASDAALEGFQIVRREPRTIAAWSLVQLVFSIAVTIATIPYMRPLMALQTTRLSGGPLSAAQAMAILEPVFGMTAVLIPLELVVVSVLSAAVYRVLLRPADKGLFRLRLGGDEFRLGILWIELGLLLWAVGAVVLVAVVVVGVALAGALKASAGAALPAVAAGYLAVLATVVWLGVRLSLAAPLTFATRRVQLFSSWKLTRGRVWPLFGCYFLTFIFTVVVLMAQVSLVAALSLVLSGGSLSQAAGGVAGADYSSLGAYLTPVRIVGLVANAVLGGIYWSIALAPSAVAYKAFAGAPAPRP